MAPPFPDGTRWHVVYSRPNSKAKLDGFLLLKYMTGNVVRRITLQDATSAHLADRFLHKDEHVSAYGTLEIKSFTVHVDALVEEFPSGPRSLPARTSFAPPAPSDRAPIGNVETRWNKAASAIPSLRSNTSVAPRRVDRAPIAIVGTKWNVLYCVNPNRKSKKMEDGFLQLVQKSSLELKVVLCDVLGRQIDELFLRGDNMEITCGKVLQFDNTFVEVGDLERDTANLAEVVVIQDSPANQKKLPWQHPRTSSQGSLAVISRVPDPDIAEVIQDSGTGRVRAPFKPRGKQETAPKRRDSGQVMNSLKRPVNTSIRDASSTASCRTRDLVETEETTMLPSTSRRGSEEDRPSTADCAGGFQKLNVGKARPESFDGECLFIKHEMKQQKYKFGNSRPGGIINLDDQFDIVGEQYEVAVESDGNEASLHTGNVFIKCSEEAGKVLDDKRFRVRDFWDGYKLYCYGYYDNCDRSKAEFLNSKMGQVVCLLHNEMDVRWGAKFDETVRQVWAMMEEYVKVCYGKDCTNLRALMEEFEDVKKLATSERGSLLLQLIKDDEHGSETLYKHSRNIKIQSTNVFDEFRSRLNQVDSNLGSLIKSSAKTSEHSSKTLNDLDKRSVTLNDSDKRSVGSKNSREKGSVNNAANMRSKPAERCKDALPSFDLGF